MPGIVNYIDDILITGKDDTEHSTHLEAVLKSFKEHGLTIKMSKCQFLNPSVEYLGKVVTKEGIQPSKKKIEAIQKVMIVHSSNPSWEWLTITANSLNAFQT